MKRLDRVIDAFVGLPDTRLVVAGGGSQRAALERRAAAAPNIRFLGVLEPEALSHWLRGARASIHVSRAEPFGLAIAESLAAGIPVLTSDEGAARELVRDGVEGEVLPPDPDVATLRAAIAGFSVPRDDSDGSGPVSSSVSGLRIASFAATLRTALLHCA
jgi:glycosyltransferase involved in cell wall biosynthesis